jgi:hypothetical protein
MRRVEMIATGYKNSIQDRENEKKEKEKRKRKRKKKKKKSQLTSAGMVLDI